MTNGSPCCKDIVVDPEGAGWLGKPTTPDEQEVSDWLPLIPPSYAYFMWESAMPPCARDLGVVSHRRSPRTAVRQETPRSSGSLP
jgi:hypothetical protein